MNELPIRVIEAAARAQHDSEDVAFPWEEMNETDRSLALLHMEAAIRAADNARVRLERRVAPPFTKPDQIEIRLVSDWQLWQSPQ